jgi:RNA polymerase sigma factor (sigma-70 family)
MRLLERTRSSQNPVVADGATDLGLVALAQADPRAFACLYRRFFDQVYWYCFGRLGDAKSAEDATSEVFAKVLAALPRYEAREPSFRAWLFRIAHNVVLDCPRQRPYHNRHTRLAN